jgi:hypothetical protein
MDELDRREDIRHFIVSNGLDKDLLDEPSEPLEAWRLKWEGLAKGFVSYLQDRFTSIEHRLDRLEGERYGHQTTEGPGIASGDQKEILYTLSGKAVPNRVEQEI